MAGTEQALRGVTEVSDQVSARVRDCCGLSVCAPPPICMLKPNPHGAVIRRWGLWELDQLVRAGPL